MALELFDNARAKINLTLRVLGRRADGYHEIESLVAFADLCDRLTLVPGRQLELEVVGPGAGRTGDDPDNLILKAARALVAGVAGIELGRFRLEKHIPVAAGMGGGSADAAATLRLLARLNRLTPGDPRLHDAARTTGADVLVCLDQRPRLMRGIGDVLSAPLILPRLFALLVNPGAALPTKLVFSRWVPSAKPARSEDAAALTTIGNEQKLLDWLASQTNDLEAPAIELAPAIADVLAALRALCGCRLARMSGSGATCFGLFASAADAASAAKTLHGKFPDWWLAETALG